MNHTHYTIIDEDNDVIAVIKAEDFKGRLIKALEDETGSVLMSLTFEEIGYYNFKVSASFSDEINVQVEIRPTFEY